MTDDNFIYDDFIKFVGVSRETYEKFEVFVELLKKWQQKINLISDNTVSNVWIRHIIDSAQLFKYLKESDNVLDIGSGAGFPGLVLAMMGLTKVTLVESDMRKTAFLREAARVTGARVSVACKRIEEMALENVDVLTARAFSSVKNILDAVSPQLAPSQQILLLKGKGHGEEIKEARNAYDFEYESAPSLTGGDGIVLILSHVLRRSKTDEHYA